MSKTSQSHLYSFFYPRRTRVLTPLSDKLVTKQNMAAECDINNILKQYSKTGILQHITQQQPTYQDLPSNIDYQTSIQIVMEAESAFATLPSKVRDHYRNSPELFLQALTNPAERDRLTEWGVFERPHVGSPASPAAPASGGSSPNGAAAGGSPPAA